jgi:hypothetical protein
MPEHQAVASQEYWLPWLSEAERRDFELKEGRFLNLMAKYKSQKLTLWPNTQIQRAKRKAD